MSERIVVACSGDWHTGAVLDTLDRLGRNTLFITLQGNPLASRSWRNVNTIALKVPLFLRIGFRLESRARGFSDAISNFWRLQWFDEQVSQLIALHTPTHCFLWAAMAERSIARARECGAKSIMFLGSTPFFFRDERQRAGERVREIAEWTDIQMRELQMSDTIWVESPFLAKSIKKYALPTRKVIALTPPIDADGLPQKGTVQESELLQVATVQGSLRKGTKLLFEIWPTLPSNARLNIYGSLERTLRKNLPGMAVYHGNLSKSAYRRQLAVNSIAVFPTFGDGGPRALFEAMAIGLCPIASDASAAPEVIQDGVSGFVIPSGDGASLKDRLLWCTAHPTETRSMGERARESILKSHDRTAFTMAFNHHFLN